MYLAQISKYWTQITDPTQPGDLGVTCGSQMQDGAYTDTLDGDVRVFPGGLVEGIGRPDDQLTMQITFMHLSAADAAKIRAWRGKTVLIRTADGERIFAFYIQTQTTRRLRTTSSPDDGTGVTFDISTTAARVTFDETLIGQLA